MILFFLFSFIGRKKEGGYPVMGFDFSLGGFTSFSASLYFSLFPVSFVYFLSIFQLLSFLFLSLPVFLYFCLSDCLSVCLSFSLFPCFSPSSLPFFPHFLLCLLPESSSLTEEALAASGRGSTKRRRQSQSVLTLPLDIHRNPFQRKRSI